MNVTVSSPRRMPRAVFWIAGLLAAAALCVLGAWSLVQQLPDLPVQVVVDGVGSAHALELAGMPPAHKVMLVLGLALLALVALVAVPVLLLVVLIVVVAAVMLGLGLPMLALLLVLGIGLSPLLALAALAWWLLRRSSAAPATVGG